MNELKEKIDHATEKHKEKMKKAERWLWEHPESGFREWGATEYIASELEALGYEVTKAGNVTGVFATVDTGRDGPTVLVLAELDSLISEAHPERDKSTGCVHACGHNAQCAALIGIAGALCEEEMLEGLSGKIRLCFVPAEEMIENEFREELIKSGTIKYPTGKCEFLSRGFFDGCDIAIMVHASNKYSVTLGNVGSVFKKTTYRGKSAHAGGCPWLGVNALYALLSGINAANSLREGFIDENHVRFHPIITHGGSAVNAIPDFARMEAYVRAADFKSLFEINERINYALVGGALSIKANVEISDSLCYAPLRCDEGLIELTKEAGDLVIPEENLEIYRLITSGSTDLGDLSCLMPCVHPYSAGICGTVHGDDFFIENVERAVVKSAKLQLAMLSILLSDNAKRAKDVISSYKPNFKSKEEYFSFISSIKKSGERIEYYENGARTVF